MKSKHIYKHKGHKITLKRRGKSWSINMMFNKQRLRQALGVSNQDEAERLANPIFEAALAGKWEAVTETKAASGSWSTIGQVVVILKENQALLALEDSTLKGYLSGLYKIVGVGMGIMDADETATPENVEKIHALRLSVLNAKTINKWIVAMLKPVKNDMKAKDSVHETINNRLRCARGVFSRKTAKKKIYSDLKIPALKELREAPFMPVISKENYTLPPEKIINAIWDNVDSLLEKFARTWFVFQLQAFAGVRRAEVLAMRWGWFVEVDGQLYIETPVERDFKTKGKEVRRIAVPEELKAKLQREALKRGWPMGDDDFVVPKGQQGPGHIREGDKGWFGDGEKGHRGFVHLSVFMRSHGWTRRQKGHEIRKIFATRVNQFNNTIDVMKALGHKDIKTTRRYVMPSTPKPVTYDYGSGKKQTCKVGT